MYLLGASISTNNLICRLPVCLKLTSFLEYSFMFPYLYHSLIILLSLIPCSQRPGCHQKLRINYVLYHLFWQPLELTKVSYPIIFYIESSTCSNAQERKVIDSDLPREKSQSIKLFWFTHYHNTLWLPYWPDLGVRNPKISILGSKVVLILTDIFQLTYSTNKSLT